MVRPANQRPAMTSSTFRQQNLWVDSQGRDEGRAKEMPRGRPRGDILGERTAPAHAGAQSGRLKAEALR